MKCQAIILKEYATKKADVFSPFYRPSEDWIPNPDAIGEVCGGDVTATIEIEYEPYFGGSDATITVNEVCSRCKSPWYLGKLYLEKVRYDTINIGDLIASVADELVNC